jgi:hypothetical protein
MSSRKGFNYMSHLERLDQPIVRPTSQKFAAGLCHYQTILTVNFSQLVESSAGRLRA